MKDSGPSLWSRGPGTVLLGYVLPSEVLHFDAVEAKRLQGVAKDKVVPAQ